MSDVARDANEALIGSLHKNSLAGTKAIAIVGGGYSGLMAIESSRSPVNLTCLHSEAVAGITTIWVSFYKACQTKNRRA
ncbi:hypothetical protein KZZ10_10220 [Alcaligenaceae bacterium LF4-65]|uniref:Uncharacterized protein n=1 Tax=Zwartia hollandica TaxID=324606 RepID=A0A953T337_9BURK|nr:hypothetical protein [Zwartia hollandica]MBZ1351020.1 hypothetical protein [Zwartia hollandica]